jgi:hypothetical protein
MKGRLPSGVDGFLNGVADCKSAIYRCVCVYSDAFLQEWLSAELAYGGMSVCKGKAVQEDGCEKNSLSARVAICTDGCLRGIANC